MRTWWKRNLTLPDVAGFELTSLLVLYFSSFQSRNLFTKRNNSTTWKNKSVLIGSLSFDLTSMMCPLRSFYISHVYISCIYLAYISWSLNHASYYNNATKIGPPKWCLPYFHINCFGLWFDLGFHENKIWDAITDWGISPSKAIQKWENMILFRDIQSLDVLFWEDISLIHSVFSSCLG